MKRQLDKKIVRQKGSLKDKSNRQIDNKINLNSKTIYPKSF